MNVVTNPLLTAEAMWRVAYERKKLDLKSTNAKTYDDLSVYNKAGWLALEGYVRDVVARELKQTDQPRTTGAEP